MEKSVSEKNDRPQIKICGLTGKEEAAYLNEAGVDYAGFVFYEKSKRNVSIRQAEEIAAGLDPGIRRVAVTVDPDEELVRKICEAGFDLLQVHGAFGREACAACIVPVWMAVNIADPAQILSNFRKAQEMAGDRLAALVADGAGYGSGKPFDWEQTKEQLKQVAEGYRLVLAGGLNAENVCQGIRIFEPDIVDVSSGVEDGNGKSRTKIQQFAGKVKAYE